MSLGSSQTVFTHDEKQLPSPKVGTQLRLHGDYASPVFPVVCAGFFSRFFSFLTGQCTGCLRFSWMYSFVTDIIITFIKLSRFLAVRR